MDAFRHNRTVVRIAIATFVRVKRTKPILHRLVWCYPTLFSGVEFNINEGQGLSGFCDFLLTLAPMVLEVRAPVVSIVEAKKENISAGIPQCFAELVVAQIFNDRAEKPIETLYGVVTSGTD